MQEKSGSPLQDPRFALIQAGLNNIDQAITIFDRDLRLIFANARVIDLLDVHPALVEPGTHFAEIIQFNARRGEYGPGDPEQMITERLAEARKFEAHTIERRRPNGIVLSIRGWPLEQGGFATIYTDVTAQRMREQELEDLVSARTAELSLNEERLRMIANAVPAGIAYLDQNAFFQFANARFARAWAREPEEVIGRHSQDILSPETFAAATPYFDRARAGEVMDFDLRMRLADGAEREVRTFLRPDAPSEGGEGRGFYVLSVNVTKEKQAAEALANTQKLEAIGRLSSGVAHDFNNLLTVVLGNLTPLAARMRSGALGVSREQVVQEMLEPAIRAARRGADLTRRLLTVARRQPVEARPVDLVEMCGDLAKLVRASLPDGVRLHLSSDSDALWAMADPAQFETAMINLAMNARDAIEDKGNITIALNRRRVAATTPASLAPGDYIEINVADDGVGVPSDAASRVFEPFFTTKTDSGGSGLGLALVHAFVLESGGHIALNSTPGAGATFTLLLPSCAPSTAPAPQPTRTEYAASEAHLILLVEDDDDVRDVMLRDLTGLGFTVVAAADGEEALALIDTLRDLSLVLSDIAMPGAVSGIALAERLAKTRPDLPVILMTGHGGDRWSAASPAAATPILRKPFDVATLANALRSALEAGH